MARRKESRTYTVDDEIIVCDFCGGDISVLQMWYDPSPHDKDTHMECVENMLKVIFQEDKILTAIKKKVKSNG